MYDNAKVQKKKERKRERKLSGEQVSITNLLMINEGMEFMQMYQLLQYPNAI